jgi:SnoaL-like domain
VTVTPEQLADLEAIREAARRYCRGVDRLDRDLMRSAYWPDGTDHHGGFGGNAWDFVDFVMASHTRWWSTMHNIFNHSVGLDPGGTSARGEVYNITTMFRDSRQGPVVDTWYGRYLDRYQAREGEWRILERVCVHEATTVQPITATMPLDASEFRPGSFDRPSAGRPIGP